MEQFISVLIVKPGETPVLKEISNNRKEFANIIGVEEEELAEVIGPNYSMFLPRFINAQYCLMNGRYPTPIIVVSKMTLAERRSYEFSLSYKSIDQELAHDLLDEIKLESKFYDQRLFPSQNGSLSNSIYNYALHSPQLSLQAKAILCLLKEHSFEMRLSEITEYCKETPVTIEKKLQELVLGEVLIEARNEDDERVYQLHPNCLDRASKMYEQFTNNVNSQLSDDEKNILSENNEENKEAYTPQEQEKKTKVDDLLEDAIQMVIEDQQASVSKLQRKFNIGYTRAARLIDTLEDQGIVGPYEGSKPRKVLVTNKEEIQINEEVVNA
jgi:predicted transcriptional regulator